jgi:hypothetical protein
MICTSVNEPGGLPAESIKRSKMKKVLMIPSSPIPDNLAGVK